MHKTIDITRTGNIYNQEHIPDLIPGQRETTSHANLESSAITLSTS